MVGACNFTEIVTHKLTFSSRGNEYTGVNFTEVPPPQLSDRSVLEPTAQPVANALGRLQRYFTAFQNCSERFRVDLVGVRPFGGDFKIIEISTQQEVFVELKDGIVEVVTDEESGSLVLRHPLANPAGPDGRRPIFTWKAQWDYLLSADLAQGHAYVFPRDKVPAGWWDRHGIGEMWEGFQAYKINLGRDRCMVRGIEEVLDRTRAENGSMRARNVRPVRPSPDEAWKETEHHLGSGDAGPVARHGWSTSGLRRGFGSAAHEELRGDTYPQWASEVLIELCRAR